MIGDQRGLSMLAAPEQGRAANSGQRPLAVKAQEKLVAARRAAGREQEIIEARMRADRGRRLDTCRAPAPSPMILT